MPKQSVEIPLLEYRKKTTKISEETIPIQSVIKFRIKNKSILASTYQEYVRWCVQNGIDSIVSEASWDAIKTYLSANLPKVIHTSSFLDSGSNENGTFQEYTEWCNINQITETERFNEQTQFDNWVTYITKKTRN